MTNIKYNAESERKGRNELQGNEITVRKVKKKKKKKNWE